MMSEVPISMNWVMRGSRKEREEVVNMTEVAINGLWPIGLMVS